VKRIKVYEPAVALTDLAVGLEAGAFALALARSGAREVARSEEALQRRRWFVVFFAATSVAAIVGAALHGLLPPRDSPARRRLWRVSLGSIGIAGLSAWCLGAVLALPRSTATRVQRTMIAVHAVYLLALTRTNPPFTVAIATYMPGALALGAGLISRLRDPITGGAAVIALAGLGLTFGAAAVQVRKIAIHPRLFDHNATYHTIQAIAIACFYGAARRFGRGEDRPV
jgi:MFS family permease